MDIRHRWSACIEEEVKTGRYETIYLIYIRNPRPAPCGRSLHAGRCGSAPRSTGGHTHDLLNPTAATTTGTRATVDGDWKGVTAVAIQIGNEVKAYRVTPSSDNLTATLSSDDPHYWAGESAVTVSAWWPYTDGQTSMPAVTVQADQRGDGYAQSDHIGVAEELLHYNGGTPTLAFTHRTARIVVTVSGGTSSISSVRLTNLSTADGNPGEIIVEALVAPQSVASGTAFVSISTTGGKTYVYRMQDNAKWTAGKEYEYAITIE